MAVLVYKDESYSIVGAALKVFREIGFGYQEKYYYRAFKLAFLALGFKVTEQLWTPLIFANKPIGGYYLDLLLEKLDAKIVVEVKVANQIYPQHIKQVLGYLKAKNVKLGILIVITKSGIIYKRIVN